LRPLLRAARFPPDAAVNPRQAGAHGAIARTVSGRQVQVWPSPIEPAEV